MPSSLTAEWYQQRVALVRVLVEFIAEFFFFFFFGKQPQFRNSILPQLPMGNHSLPLTSITENSSGIYVGAPILKERSFIRVLRVMEQEEREEGGEGYWLPSPKGI